MSHSLLVFHLAAALIIYRYSPTLQVLHALLELFLLHGPKHCIDYVLVTVLV